MGTEPAGGWLLLPKGCPRHLCGVWDLQVSLALDGVAQGPGCPHGDDITVKAAPFSCSWLSRRLDHRAKPGLGFCWELLIGLAGTGPEKHQKPLPLGPQGGSPLSQGAAEKGVSASSWWQLTRQQLH